MTESFTTPTRSNSVFNMNPELTYIRKQIANAIMNNKDFIYVKCPRMPHSYCTIEDQLRKEGYHVSNVMTCFGKMKWKISW